MRSDPGATKKEAASRKESGRVGRRTRVSSCRDCSSWAINGTKRAHMNMTPIRSNLLILIDDSTVPIPNQAARRASPPCQHDSSAGEANEARPVPKSGGAGQLPPPHNCYRCSCWRSRCMQPPPSSSRPSARSGSGRRRRPSRSPRVRATIVQTMDYARTHV